VTGFQECTVSIDRSFVSSAAASEAHPARRNPAGTQGCP
jgi:hypothetical protein